jgi:hypothetical protein
MQQTEVKKIEMLDGDFYDNEKGVYVLTFGNAAIFPSEAKIIDFDGVAWDCYLWRVKYFPKTDQYEAEYKTY